MRYRRIAGHCHTVKRPVLPRAHLPARRDRGLFYCRGWPQAGPRPENTGPRHVRSSSFSAGPAPVLSLPELVPARRDGPFSCSTQLTTDNGLQTTDITMLKIHPFNHDPEIHNSHPPTNFRKSQPPPHPRISAHLSGPLTHENHRARKLPLRVIGVIRGQPFACMNVASRRRPFDEGGAAA
jgi:hypothetical protein